MLRIFFRGNIKYNLRQLGRILEPILSRTHRRSRRRNLCAFFGRAERPTGGTRRLGSFTNPGRIRARSST